MADSVNPPLQREPGAATGVFAMGGCAIALFVFLATAIFAVVAGVMQNSGFGDVAEDTAREYPIPAPSAEEIEVLEAKLKILATAAEVKRETTVELTVDELNGLIATQQLLADMRGETRVRRITKSQIEIEMSLPIRKLPIGFRFINGNYFFVPQNLGGSWQLSLFEVQTDKGPLSPDAVEMWRELQLMRFDSENPALRPFLRQLESVALEDGKVILKTFEGEAPPVGGK